MRRTLSAMLVGGLLLAGVVAVPVIDAPAAQATPLHLQNEESPVEGRLAPESDAASDTDTGAAADGDGSDANGADDGHADVSGADADGAGTADDAGASADGGQQVAPPVDNAQGDAAAGDPPQHNEGEADREAHWTEALIGLDPLTAAAASSIGSSFRAGYIISNENFYNGNAMTASQVQTFLNGQVPNPTSSSLRNYRQNTTNKARTDYCAAYTGRAGETAAQIIANVGQACGISQRVILVMLQKESSIVGYPMPSQGSYDRAMGYACPDSGPNGTANCNTAYYGFFNQVWHGTQQLKRYGMDSYFSWFPVGKSSRIYYGPAGRKGCPNPGFENVTIQNKATAALYYYTPYIPNQALLNGTPDACSSYGNYNFFMIYSRWFGSPNTTYVDVPRSHPFYRHIEWMAQNRYAASGPENTRYQPAASTSRGAMATFLRRMHEPGYRPAASLKLPYRDVPTSHPHYRGIAWLYQRGYAVKADYFFPESVTNRGAMATFLYRIEGGKASNLKAPPYSDVPASHPHARAISWMAQKRYAASGPSAPTYNPAGATSRGSMAAFLSRMYS